MKKHDMLSGLLLALMTLFTLSASAQPDKNYLCFTANTDNSTVKLSKIEGQTEVYLQFSTDDGENWLTYTIGTAVTLNEAGDKVYFRNVGTAETFSTNHNIYNFFTMTGSIAASGNVMSLVDQSCKATAIPCAYCFCKLFFNCTALTAAPELPATELAANCYSDMFSGCSALTMAPELPATTMKDNCYNYMFKGCTALKTAPELPATTLEQSCYNGMFQGCSALATAPKLPATTLANTCYGNMFNGCALTTAPELPATKLEQSCYGNMFNGCSALTTAPELPATELKLGCYNSMFKGCSALTMAPELPATKLETGCYNNMFNGCEKLTTAPELPATTLANQCYSYMFNGCSALTTAPELPATKLETGCYNNMFNGCEKLNDMKVAFSILPSSSYINSWVSKVASAGTFVWAGGTPHSSKDYGTSKIPSDWTVKNTYNLTFASGKQWASLCVNLPLQVPGGVEVYYASAVEGSTITLTQIAAGTVMAPRTAVIVKGTGTVGFPISNATATSYDGNLFQGSSVAKACNARENYVLNASMSDDENVHFSIYTGTTLTDHKAWLPMSAVGGASSIQFRFGDATAISTAETEVAEDAIYNLAGQRVGSDYRGIVIKNGKKVYNK